MHKESEFAYGTELSHEYPNFTLGITNTNKKKIDKLKPVCGICFYGHR